MNRETDPRRGLSPNGPTRPIHPVARQAPGNAAGGPHRGWTVAETQPLRAVPAEPGLDQAAEQAAEQTTVIRPVSPGKPSLLKASGSMAIATLVSRITGFLWKLILAAAISFGVINDSFTVANTLPNSIFELLIGGVLTSVVVPVLVRSQKSDPDHGLRFKQQLMTMAVVLLGLGTVLAVLCAPLLAMLFVSESQNSNIELVNVLAYLLLPQIFFYGISALAGAILQANQVFSPPAWAPVVNNLVVIATIGVYVALPGEMTLNPVSMDDAHVLTLGIGVTLGVVCQALIQVPALRRTGFRWGWKWGWDSRLSEFGGLALWMLAYVAVSQVGLIALSRVASGSGDSGAWSIYNYVWMLLQLPYGVIGFSIMTAILPRMSAAAADNDNAKVIEDLSLGNRLSTVTLLPVSAIMTALGVPLALALFALRGSTGSATTLGLALAVSAFGVLPYALTLMQMRTFNALNDARTPTLIMVVMTVAKVLLAIVVADALPRDAVVYGLTAVNSLTFVVGWLVGELWLRSRLGPLGSSRFLKTLAKSLLASIIGGLAAWGASVGIDGLIAGPAGAGTGWLQLILGSVVGFAVIFGLMSILRVDELGPATRRVTGLLHRR